MGVQHNPRNSSCSPRRVNLWCAVTVMLLIGVTGCGDDATSSKESAGTLTISDAWVKTADSGMSAAFGVLHNPGGKDVTVVSAESDATTRMELHEVVPAEAGGTVMRPKEGGFVIAAGRSHTLAPGGDHLMLMELTRPIKPGDEITFTLKLAGGSSVALRAQAKAFAGGNEKYHAPAAHQHGS